MRRARLFTLAVVTCASVTVPMMPMTGAQASANLCDGRATTIVGTNGPDVLHGTPENDVIAGLGGDDQIFGGGGDDVICGDNGADRLRGDVGDDVLFAGKARWVDKRAGSGYRPDWLDGGPGDDTLEIGTEPVHRGYGISGVVTFGTAAAGVVVDLAENSAVGDGNDTIFPRPGLAVIGTPADDVLSGSDLLEEIQGAGGADTIDGRGGDDHLYGDPEGAEEGAEGANDDKIVGGAGKDVLVGTLGADVLRGGAGLDLVRAEGLGAGRAIGGEGDDFLYLTLSTHDGVKLLGGQGRDDATIDLHESVPESTELLVNVGSQQIALDQIAIGKVAKIERLHAETDAPFRYYGTSGPDEVYASANGRLRAWTGGGNDVVWGSNLDDRIFAGTGFDEVRGGLGRDLCKQAEDRRGCEQLSP